MRHRMHMFREVLNPSVYRRTGLVAGLVTLTGLTAPVVLSAQENNPGTPGPATVVTQDRQSGSSPAASVTLVVSDTPLSAILNALAKQSRRPIVFDNAHAAFSQKKSVTIRNASIMQALGIALKGTTLQAAVAPDKETIVVRPISDSVNGKGSQGQKTTVSGTVADSATGQPIGGVAITIMGTDQTVLTSDKGIFSLKGIPAGEHVITAKLFGFRAVSRPITVTEQPATLRIALTPIPTTLSGVVTTATGLQRRLEISSDVTSINVDSVMAIAPIRSVTELLESRVPGLQVMKTSGTPGDPSRLRLRGTSSLNGSNAPIVIVDGIRIYSPDGSDNPASSSVRDGVPAIRSNYFAQSPLDQIDPNIIDRIEVFKGPSASSLYGSDAANGVIVITTKRGRSGPARWTAALNMGTSNIPGKFPENIYLFGQKINQAHGICEYWERCEIDSVVSFQALNNSLFSPLGRASSSNVSGSFSGGSDRLLYSFTGSASTEQGLSKLPGSIANLYRSTLGVSPPSWMRRPERYQTLSAGNSITVTASPTMTVVVNNSVTRSEQRRTSLSTAAGPQLMGRYIGRDMLGLGVDQQPILTGYQERAITTMLSSQHNVSFQWQARPNIPVQLIAGMNPGRTTGTTLLPAGIPRVLLGGLGGADTNGAYSVGNRNTMMNTVSARSVVPIQLPNGTRLDIAVGSDFVRSDNNAQTISTTYIPLGVTDPSSFIPQYTTNSQSKVATSTYGFLLEPRLALASRVFLHTGLRMDGGSASGDRVGLNGYPKLGISWIAIDNLSSGNNAGWRRLISQLRLRSTIGQAGVQPNALQHLRLFQTGTFTEANATTVIPTYIVSTVGNDLLRPERAVEFEGGPDLEFLEQRISLGMTFYRKHQRDAIMNLTVAPSVGLGVNPMQYVNIGNVLNTGLEATLNAQAIQTPQVRWDINVLFSQRRNRLTSRAGDFPVLESAMQLVVGYPVTGYWGRPVIGYADRNDDGVLQMNEIAMADSLAYLGSSEPRYTTTFNNTVSLFNGRLTANASVEYQNGLTQYNVKALDALETAASAPDASLLDQAIAVVSTGNSTYYLTQTVNTLRFRSLSIGYTLPQIITRALRAGQATVSLQGSNLGLRTNYRGKDPDVNGYGGGIASADYGAFPQPREWILRFNFTR